MRTSGVERITTLDGIKASNAGHRDSESQNCGKIESAPFFFLTPCTSRVRESVNSSELADERHKWP